MDHVGLYGLEWLYDVWKYIQEDKAEYYRITMSLMPLARTPMDRRSGSNLQKYAKQLSKSIDSIAPWVNKEKRRRENLRNKLKPGEVVVFLDGDESPDDPLYKGVKTVRE